MADLGAAVSVNACCLTLISAVLFGPQKNLEESFRKVTFYIILPDADLL
jgi:hypothetical protein